MGFIFSFFWAQSSCGEFYSQLCAGPNQPCSIQWFQGIDKHEKHQDYEPQNYTAIKKIFLVYLLDTHSPLIWTNKKKYLHVDRQIKVDVNIYFVRPFVIVCNLRGINWFDGCTVHEMALRTTTLQGGYNGLHPNYNS